ncbi:hypothetical protein BGZ61DRAFT_14663 [Ilyonectria robusta]|uniref:uncharacterized protein n=1 Tax=Ilyonectria robusta TaxID=1079257 RepID=UPI001E8D3DEC|nr:uncharacterized protein BGZ61DRAFT_14663 [Ilyonectria robusta]KAH8737380.1 hypothetical protein BGZ61DRAFT_14663 [Ilyonectria robusta]
MADYVEFYVTCNPPLLPTGVASTIAHLREAPHQDKVLEMLYEPEIPWFKIITAQEHQEEITHRIHSFLELLLEEETDVIDEDQPGDLPIDPKTRADVDLVTETPQVIPWSLYQHNKCADTTDYDEHRFPAQLEPLAFKTVWRGLESADGLSISDLFAKFDFLWAHPGQASGLQKLGAQVNCQFTHNMRGNLVYIGSDKEMECVRDAVRKLENLLALCNSLVPSSSHLVFTEDERITKLSFRWLTHVGLDKLTYLNTGVSGTLVENRPLNRAASIRVEIIKARGRSELDETVYPIGTKQAVPFRPSFSAFADFEYRAKSPGFMPVDTSKELTPEPASKQNLQLPDTKSITCSSTSSVSTSVRMRTTPAVDVSHGDKSRGSEVSRFAPGEPSFGVGNEGDTTVEKTQTHESLGFVQEPLLQPNDTMRLSSAPSLLGPLAAADAVASWIAGIEAAGFNPSLYGISELGPPDDVPAMTDSIPSFGGDVLVNLEPDTESSVPPPNDEELSGLLVGQLYDSSNLMEFGQHHSHQATMATPNGIPTECLLDSDSPPGLDYGMFAPMNLLRQQEPQRGSPTIRPPVPSRVGIHDGDLLGCLEAHIDTPALMDEFDGQGAATSAPDTSGNTIGVGQEAEENALGKILRKMDSKEKELFYTMGQKAAPSQTWAHVASQSKVQQKEEETSFGVNVPVKVRSNLSRPGPQKLEAQKLEEQEAVRKMPKPTPTQPTTDGQGGTQSKRANLSRVVDDTNKKAKELLKILQITPGHIRLEAKFGRICINDLETSLVNLGQGPSLDIHEILNFRHDSIGFHTILTTNGAEADLIPRMSLSQGQPWELYDKQVYYDIVCKSKDKDDLIMVEVNAATFNYVCRSPTQEFPGVYIHCARRSWDIQLSVSRIGSEEIPEDFRQFASSLIESLDISTDNEGQVVIKANPDKTSRWGVEGTSIRHIARYRNGSKSRNYLAITTTRVAQRIGGSNYHGTTRPVPIPGKGPLSQWFEASIGSTRADELLRENVGLGFGDKTSWTPDQLVKEGLIKALCDPALKMVMQMDQVGRTNCNGEGLKVGQNSSTKPTGGGALPFW